MIRLYPIPYRYLQEKFPDWTWITANVKRDDSDPRPESFKIDVKSIDVGDHVPSRNAAERKSYVDQSPHVCQSVAELKSRQTQDRLSLGIVRAGEFVGSELTPRSEDERADWERKEDEITAQYKLLEGGMKPLDFPEAKFVVRWTCADAMTCSCGKRPHRMALHDWGIHELYRKVRMDADGGRKIADAIRQRLDTAQRDVYMYLGSFRTVMNNFGFMGAFSVKKTNQIGLW